MSGDLQLTIRPTEQTDQSWIRDEIRKWWGDDSVIVRGRKYYPANYDGFIATIRDDKVGLLTLRYDQEYCEIMSLTTSDSYPITGRRLIEAAISDARKNKAERMVVVTTNDNTNALRFYQVMGFRLHELRKGILIESRKLKPKIPLLGQYNIPISDEIELELFL